MDQDIEPPELIDYTLDHTLARRRLFKVLITDRSVTAVLLGISETWP